MQISTVQSILSSRFDASQNGESYQIDPEHRLVVIAQHENGVMQMPKVTELEFAQKFIVVTSDDSRYFIPVDSIFGLKAGALKNEAEEGRPGFRRP